MKYAKLCVTRNEVCVKCIVTNNEVCEAYVWHVQIRSLRNRT